MLQSSHICILIFSIVLSKAEPLLGNIQDISHQVWFFQDQTLTAVPRKNCMVPGEWPRSIGGSPFGQCCCVFCAELFSTARSEHWCIYKHLKRKAPHRQQWLFRDYGHKVREYSRGHDWVKKKKGSLLKMGEYVSCGSLRGRTKTKKQNLKAGQF